jgi:hypothetical protein
VAIHQCLHIGCKSRWAKLFIELKHVQSLVLDFKVYKRFQDFILWINKLHVNHNHMSLNVLSLCITTRFWKDSFCYYFKVYDSHSNAFSFNNYTFKLNGQLNNTLFMFWRMNLKYNFFFWPTYYDCKFS